MKSVFISSTAKDLGDHRAAVKAAIERLDLRPIDMRNFGSQPGGAVGVSVREVGKADIFVGILAQRYGYVPEGMTKSVTEQEYDEAVQRKLPRLMYLLDENFAWDVSLVENDPLAQQRLKNFKDRVNADEVRSLFTTPDNLARQVTADLTKLLDKQRQHTLITRILAAVLLVVGIIALVLLADTGIRDQAFKIVGIASPTLTPSTTPTATFTPSPTPTPTNTPLPTATSLEGAPFADDEVGIVFAEFDLIDSNAPRTERNIERELEDAGVSFIRVRHTLENREEAQQVAELYNATLVIWGEVALGGAVLNFEINAPPERVQMDVDGFEVSAAQLDSFAAYIFNGMDILYIVEFIRAQLAFFENNYDASLAYLDSALNRIPAERQADVQAGALFIYRGSIYGLQGKYADALAAFNHAIELNPQDSVAHHQRGNVYSLQGKHDDEALADFNRAIAFDPENSSAYRSRGVFHNTRGNYAEALADFNRAIALDPEDYSTYSSRGLLYNNQALYDEALADFNRAMQLNSEYSTAYYYRGKLFVIQELYDEAFADFNRAIALNPNSDELARIYIERSELQSIQGQYVEALADINRAIELEPSVDILAFAYITRGLFYTVQGNSDEVLADFNRAIALNPSFDVLAIAYTIRGLFYTGEGRYEEALTDYNRAIELYPDVADIYSSRAEVHYQLGNYTEALADYRDYERLTGTLEPFMQDQIAEMEAALTATPVP